MVDLKGGSGQLAAILDAPCERVEARIDGASGSSTMIEIHGAQTNHGTESASPDEARQLQRQVGIRLKLQSVGTGSGLGLVNHQSAREPDTIGPQLPAGGFVIGGACEWPAAQHQQVASVLEERENIWPGLFGKRRTIRHYQQPGGGIFE